MLKAQRLRGGSCQFASVAGGPVQPVPGPIPSVVTAPERAVWPEPGQPFGVRGGDAERGHVVVGQADHRQPGGHAAYRAVDRSAYPNIWRIRDELDGVTDDAIFEQILATVVTGLQHQAPNPCTCGVHQF